MNASERQPDPFHFSIDLDFGTVRESDDGKSKIQHSRLNKRDEAGDTEKRYNSLFRT